ncbi:uncharacterized protein NH340_JMT08919 [Sarcoptes scabiei]|nr:uncharacterized protein NH340_JMT08919 [Sarcoptes scabiei]
MKRERERRKAEEKKQTRENGCVDESKRIETGNRIELRSEEMRFIFFPHFHSGSDQRNKRSKYSFVSKKKKKKKCKKCSKRDKKNVYDFEINRFYNFESILFLFEVVRVCVCVCGVREMINGTLERVQMVYLGESIAQSVFIRYWNQSFSVKKQL